MVFLSSLVGQRNIRWQVHVGADVATSQRVILVMLTRSSSLGCRFIQLFVIDKLMGRKFSKPRRGLVFFSVVRKVTFFSSMEMGAGTGSREDVVMPWERGMVGAHWAIQRHCQ